MTQGLSSDEWARLYKEYDSTIPEKITLLQQLIGAIEKNPSLENLQALRQAVHKLAGNSSMYGYLEVSSLCKQFEQEIVRNIEQKSPFDRKEYLRDITQAFQRRS